MSSFLVPVHMYHNWGFKVRQPHAEAPSVSFNVFKCEEFDPLSTFDSLIINILLFTVVSFTISWAMITTRK